MWEYEQKNGGKETRSERKEGGAVWAISVTTQATHICYHTKETLFGFTAQTAKEARLTERYRHRSIEADWHLCFYHSSKMKNIIVFGFLQKL